MARVLVVEDEPTMRELVMARLKAAGHQIVAAESGAAAATSAESATPVPVTASPVGSATSTQQRAWAAPNTAT